jgi:hypothetical protein
MDGKLFAMVEEDLLDIPKYLSTWTNLVLGHAATAASALNKLHTTTKKNAKDAKLLA